VGVPLDLLALPVPLAHKGQVGQWVPLVLKVHREIWAQQAPLVQQAPQEQSALSVRPDPRASLVWPVPRGPQAQTVPLAPPVQQALPVPPARMALSVRLDLKVLLAPPVWPVPPARKVPKVM
jgi:hypothetical protein